MSGGAAGGLVARAFESLLKECSNKKYDALQSAVQTCLDSGMDFNQQANIGETKQASSAAPKQSGSFESTAEGAEPTTGSGSITTVSEIGGHTQGGPDADILLNPLRLAFETKNVKLVELALDCFHKLIVYNHLEGDPGLDNDNNSKLLTDILNMVCGCVENSTPDSITLQVMKVLLTAVASTKVRVHGEPLLGAIRVCFNIALTSKSPINQATSRATLTQMLSIVFRQMENDVVSSKSPNEVQMEDGSNDILSVKHLNSTSILSVEGIQNFVTGSDIKGLEAFLQKAVDLEDDSKLERGTGQKSLSVAQHDALVLFCTLCKMAMKEGNDEVTTKNRILALELLQGILGDSSDSFTKNFQFIDSLRGHLSYALLRSSVSQSPVLFQHAAAIFSVILLRFRESLKAEIEVFFPLIVLKALDGSDLNQRVVVLRILEKLCKDPQMLVDLYVNFDCDSEAPNLFEKMVATLSKLAQGTQNVDPKSSAASQTSSLQGLVNILKSLVIWEKAHRKSEKQNEDNKLSGVSARELDESKDTGESLRNFDEFKSTVEASVSEFNQQPAKGIEHLISSELVHKNPASVAQFLRHNPTLDKAMIGDYLGQDEEFPVTVMHSYMESINFSGMKIDIAIREFLEGFEIPGEAQKVDRIIETFAERYCADNPGLFKNADTAYVLAYAIIMLKADAYCPKGWPKISKSDFIHINTSSAEESLSEEYLEEIYDNIVKDVMTMKDDSVESLRSIKAKLELDGRGGLLNVLNLSFPKRIFSADAKSENEEVLKQIQSIIKDQGERMGVFYSSQRIEILRPMVDVVGWPLLANFSVAMGEAENIARISICMEGFKEGILITHVLRMDTIRYAFLTSLLRYNSLHAPRDMRAKNVEALRTLLGLCVTDIDALRDSWLATLECVSRLEYVVSWPAMTATIVQGLNQVTRDAIIYSLRELSGKATDQVFVNSIKLPSESVVEFFSALCYVSAEELKQTPPRTFSLQKIVEISYYNMARIRMVWARIWSVLAQHFIFAGSHADEKVAIYAIDSLQRIGMKYLEHAEPANFTFQKGILKPFVTLMQSSESASIRRLILSGIVQILRSKSGSIKSGWQSIFMIFTMAANDGLESIVERAFENVEQVILEHFNQVIVDCFMDCVNCLIAFANNKSSVSISLKAIALLRISEDRLSEGLIPVGYLKPIDHSTVDESHKLAEHYWFPMLSGLSKLISDPRSEVSNCALEVLFDLLNERGSIFSSAFWDSIFREILFPIFDHVRHAGKENFMSSGDEWLRESTVHALQLLCDLFNTFYKDVCFMLPPLLSLLLDCAKKTDQSVVSIALGALVHLIEVGGHQFSSDDWVTLLKSLKDAVHTTQPRELLNDLAFENAKNPKVLSGDLDRASSVSGDLLYNNHHLVHNNGSVVRVASTNGDEKARGQNQETVRQVDVELSQGTASPSERAARSDGENLMRSQTFGEKFMGNMRDNLFVRNFTSKPKITASDLVIPSSSAKYPDDNKEPEAKDDEESRTLGTIRSKCITQLLLLGSIDGIQKKYWDKLSSDAKITMMEILFTFIEFAASYNSYTNLRSRMHQVPAERPPLNLLRQELTGTSIYLEVLLKTAVAAHESQNDEEDKEEKLEGVAAVKLVSFCQQVLRDASEFQSSMEETTNMEVHRVLELRSPVVVKVLKGMCLMNPQIFKEHLKEFYPYITKLVCCEQMEVRGALADLFSMQMSSLLP